MNSIYILNQNMTLEGIIDDYISVIWHSAYNEIGEFEICLGATEKALKLFKKNMYAVRSKDISVDVTGKTRYDNVMIIKRMRLITDVEEGDTLIVTGKELKYILHQRIVWKQTSLTGTAENAIRRLITENAIEPEDKKRIIPALELDAATGLIDSIDKQTTGDFLDEVVREICVAYNYGWKMFINDGKMVVSVYKGVDRSHGQRERPYVVFSDSFENLYNTDYQLSTEAYANTTLIGGEGEGVERIYIAIGDDNVGLNRFEMFTDARDISQNKDSEDEIALDTYLKLLQERGQEKLAEATYTEGFAGEVISGVTFEYGKDFFDGDIVTVINSYGISRNARVTSVIESEDADGVKIIPQFNL